MKRIAFRLSFSLFWMNLILSTVSCDEKDFGSAFLGSLVLHFSDYHSKLTSLASPIALNRIARRSVSAVEEGQSGEGFK